MNDNIVCMLADHAHGLGIAAVGAASRRDALGLWPARLTTGATILGGLPADGERRLVGVLVR